MSGYQIKILVQRMYLVQDSGVRIYNLPLVICIALFLIASISFLIYKRKQRKLKQRTGVTGTYFLSFLISTVMFIIVKLLPLPQTASLCAYVISTIIVILVFLIIRAKKLRKKAEKFNVFMYWIPSLLISFAAIFWWGCFGLT